MEVDIVMDGSTPLWKAHDISQQLQDKIEDLPNVERAFVHVDHEWTHVPVCRVWDQGGYSLHCSIGTPKGAQAIIVNGVKAYFTYYARTFL